MSNATIQDVLSRNCTQAAIDDFPAGLFSKEQREGGAIVIHALVSLYLFVALAVVCDKYFVPAVDRICHALNMSNDVAGATFMAAATSAPELFVNVIGTFITEGDIGVGTIVGSAVFNILAVAACCGIGAGMVVPLDWWPLTRDCLAYGFTVSVLICIMHDERVEWYEALILVLLYVVYICIMYYDKAFQKCVRGSSKHLMTIINKKKGSMYDISDSEKFESKLPLQSIKVLNDHQLPNGILKMSGPLKRSDNITSKPPDANSKINAEIHHCDGNISKEIIVNEKSDKRSGDRNVIENEGKQKYDLNKEIFLKSVESEKDIEVVKDSLEMDEYEHSLWRWPKNRSCITKTTWIVTWPIYLIFLFTIPDCEKPRLKNWFPLTFVMCIVWIGSLSYFVAWMITIIGDTLKIPDSVMGITFLAAGTSVPEAVSSVIVAKQGHGSMGISNSIGSNTFDILLCLGLPWLIKSSLAPKKEGLYVVEINSTGLEYSAISLLSTLLLLYLTFWYNKFKLDAAVGRACLCMYAVFLVLATLIELNVFFQVNKPTCR